MTHRCTQVLYLIFPLLVLYTYFTGLSELGSLLGEDIGLIVDTIIAMVLIIIYLFSLAELSEERLRRKNGQK